MTHPAAHVQADAEALDSHSFSPVEEEDEKASLLGSVQRAVQSTAASAPRVAPAPSRLLSDSAPTTPVVRRQRRSTNASARPRSFSSSGGADSGSGNSGSRSSSPGPLPPSYGASNGCPRLSHPSGGFHAASYVDPCSFRAASHGGPCSFPGPSDLNMESIPGLGGLAPIRCTAAAFECAAHLADSPKLPLPVASTWSLARTAALLLLVVLSLVGLRYATPDNIHEVVQVSEGGREGGKGILFGCWLCCHYGYICAVYTVLVVVCRMPPPGASTWSLHGCCCL